MYGRLALVITLALTAAPGAAVAAPPDPAALEAVTELVDGEMWQKVTYRVHRGEEVTAALGVISVQAAPVRGLVAEVRAYGDLEFTRHYRNCWYTTGTDAEIAWCQFDDAIVPGHGGLTLEAPMVSVRPDAAPGHIHGLPFRWQSLSWAASRGGLRKVVDYFKVPGAAVTRGTDGVVGLRGRALPMADIRTNGNFAPLELVDGPAPASPSAFPATSSPSATASPAPSATASPSPAATASPSRAATAPPSAAATVAGTGQDPGAEPGAGPGAEPGAGPGAEPGAGPGEEPGGAGLPVTGGQTAGAAGIGVALLLSGVATLMLARRRRQLY
ncbi:LPXTG cell wall anchor domain-containing protein [Actinoplanes sp. CA-051413]|uniref:LPXTG cell wall anchor domain-containing protein n=1 Tax=Actinoplanes sp. CA-051413 TaxID=3239899 RepID=UPI003D96C66A